VAAASAILAASSPFIFAASIEPGDSASADAGQAFVLTGGDYKWVPIIVRRTPTAVDCHFEVLGGNRTVHGELVSARDFLLFSHGHDYETLAETRSAGSGGFRRMIETPGRYRVVIANDRGALTAAVTLTVHLDVDPAPATVSTGISPIRRFVVVMIALTLFSVTALWSGSKLLHAYRNRSA
jgi:hypothetical protein